MAEACYSARASTKAQVVAKIARLLFKKNDNGQYTHNAIATLACGIKHIMKGTYNPCDAGKGMRGLLIQNAYRPKSNKAITSEAVLKEVREAADKETKRQRQRAQQQPRRSSIVQMHKRRQIGATWRHKQGSEQKKVL